MVSVVLIEMLIISAVLHTSTYASSSTMAMKKEHISLGSYSEGTP